MNHDVSKHTIELEALRRELERQNEQLAQCMHDLQALGGDTALMIEAEWLEDFERACTPPAPLPHVDLHPIRM